jgi:molybdopterin-containing oxidoreductase family molybdopterin binding subunit
MSEESFVYTCCPGWGDHEFCVIKTVVKDGQIVRTEKADYAGAEANEGYICQKGIMSCRQPYNPRRLTKPLKRRGARGGGEWDEISWDQALDEIAAKLLDLRERYGAESLAMWDVVASVPPSQGLAALLASRFIGLWGATDPIQGYGLDNGPFFAAYYDMGEFYRYMTTDPCNFDSSKYIIVWGANPVENQQRIAKHLVEARSRGAKIVDIGLIFDATAGFADWFIPVRPGSDTALALCMANLIVTREQYDAPFMLTHTVAPLLVRDDDGLFLRDANNNYLVWDSEAGIPHPVTPGVKELGIETAALNGNYVVDGTPCKTAFARLREHLAPYTPEYQESITGVPAADALRLTDEYVSAKPAYIFGALGLRYQNQGESYRSFYLLGMLTGNLGIPGGGVTSEMLPAGWPLIFNDGAISMPLGRDAYKGKYLRQADFYEQIESGEPYQIKALWVVAGNPVHNCPNRGRWIDEVFPKLELIVDVDIWMTDTGEYSDYVLPDCMPFERMELAASASYNHIVLTEPAIEPIGEAKDPTFLYGELAKRVGLGEYFDKTVEEWIDIRLQSSWPLIAGINPPVTVERLKQEKMVRAATPPVAWDPFIGMEFGTPSARLEFYSERLVPVGAQIASYREPLEVPTLATLSNNDSAYPYQFFSGRQRFFMQSMFTDDPVMAQLSGGKPTARINPLDAAQEDIIDGDKCEVFNQRGHVIASMRLDESIPPGTIQVWFGWRHEAFEEGMYSELIVPLGSRETLNDIADLWWQNVKDQGGVQPGFATGGIGGMAGSWDTIWDCACSVRKVAERKEI